MNKKYRVEITETRCKVIDIRAETEEDAIVKAKTAYYGDKIVFGNEAFYDASFSIFNLLIYKKKGGATGINTHR